MNHFKLSFAKSILRILGSIVACAFAATQWYMASLIVLGASFGVAEILGIAEELFDKRKEE